MLHGSCRFLHDASSAANESTSLSIGLVARKYWTKLVHISTVLQQHEERSRSIPPASSNSNPSKHCQTLQTSLGPCASCAKLQQCLRDHGQRVIDLCHEHDLPSSLAHHRCATSDDADQWSTYQTKDVDGLAKHLEQLQTKSDKTKKELSSVEARCKNLEETNRRLQQTLNEDKHSKKVLQELHDTKMIDLKKAHEQQESNLNEQFRLLNEEKTKLEEQVKRLADECQLREGRIQQLGASLHEKDSNPNERLTV